MDECCFKMEYDILVLGVGSINNTFGIKGVQEHTFFFKSITDANKLRRQVSECFERAALPNTSDKVMIITMMKIIIIIITIIIIIITIIIIMIVVIIVVIIILITIIIIIVICPTHLMR